MSRPRKVPYEEVISAWLRCGDATVVAATLKMGKSTVYKILNRYEYGLLGVDGGEPLALREQKPKADQDRLDECETAGLARLVVTALVVALPVALAAYMVWDWWVAR